MKANLIQRHSTTCLVLACCILKVVLVFLLGRIHSSLVIFKLHPVVGNKQQARLFRQLSVQTSIQLSF